MDKKKLKEALEKSQFISDPETLTDLLEESANILKDGFPGQEVTPQAAVSMAHLIMYFEEDVFGDDQEQPKDE